MLRALILDFDGLIIDSEMAVWRAWTETYADYGAQFPDDLWLPMVGTRELDDEPWRHLVEVTGRDIDRLRLEAEKRERSVRFANELGPRPGVLSLLASAAERGLSLAIASSSSAWWVEGHLARLGLRERFSVICTAEQAGPGKPAPDVYLAALAGLRVAASEALAFEDSEHGVAAAKAAGIVTIAVPGSFSERMDFSAADAVIASLAEFSLDEWLEGTR